MRHMLTIAGLVAAMSGAAWAQAEPEGQVDPIKELQEALQKMRSAEELLAQSGREEAARDQGEVEQILRKLLDDAEMQQQGAAQKMLKGAEKAAVGVSQNIERALGSIQFKQGQGQGQGMEMKQQPGDPRQEKPQDRQSMERGQEPKGGQEEQKQQGEQKTGEQSGNQAQDVYDAQGKGGRPAGRDVDPDAWYDQMPAKLQEDALKERMENWPGRYDDLIREWQKTLAKLGSKR